MAVRKMMAKLPHILPAPYIALARTWQDGHAETVMQEGVPFKREMQRVVAGED